MPFKSILSIKRFTLTVLGLFLFFFAQGQMEIHFPTERAVFQRDLNNEGTIYISGSIGERVDKLEVRLKEYKNGVLVDFKDWEEIQNNSQVGGFKGAVKVKGGWYQLQIRAIKGEQELYQRVLNKVGVGEVFVICGQSNAQGISGLGATGAKDDRVNCANFLNENYSKEPNTSLVFSQLKDNTNIGPIGLSPWCWGQVGDSLASQLGVPIMFFNAALTRTLSSNWYQSSVGEPTKDAIFQGLFQPGFPYQYLKTTMQYYGSLFGVRAVLWHQGETDTYPGVPVEEEIFGYYKGLIENIRKDFGQNMAWMFSRVSYSEGRTSQVVLKSHDRIIKEPNFNIFEGPSTDSLMIPRYDEVHFGNKENIKGLEILAGAWIEKLNTSFFGACQPILSNPLVDLGVMCVNENQARILLPSKHSLYQWADGDDNVDKVATSGVFNADLRDSLGNYKISSSINLNAVIFERPTVFSEKSTLCKDEKLILSSNDGFENLVWNNGIEARTLEVSEGGLYTYSAQNAVGCTFLSTEKIITAIPEPEFAKELGVGINGNITKADAILGICEGDVVNAKAVDGFDGYIWSDGQIDKERELTTDTELTYKGLYGPNCISDASSKITVNVYTLPPKPSLVSEALFEINVVNVEDFDGFVWERDLVVLDKETAIIKFRESGNYAVVGYKDYDGKAFCLSEKSEVIFKDLPDVEMNLVYPNPAIDFVHIESPEIQKNVKIRLYNDLGKLVSEIPLIRSWETKISIPLRGLPAGVYILLLESKESLLRKKIIIL